MKSFKLFITTLLAGCCLLTGAAEWVGITVTDGTFYLYNIGTGKFLNDGDPNADWGTHGWLTADWGIDVTLATSGDGYTIDTKFSNGGTKHYLNPDNGYLDADPNTFIFTQGEGNTYTISFKNKYLTGSDNAISFADASNDASQQWKLVTRAEMITALSSATKDNPVDATILITSPDFTRNDTRIASAWPRTSSGGNVTIAGPSGGRKTYGCEFWNNTFDIHQVIADAPAGIYELTVQGFGTNGTTIIYAGEKEAPFANTTGTGNFGQVLDAINNGEYTGNTTGKFAYISGDLTVGIKRTENKDADWVVFDNFKLTYYGVDLESFEAELNAIIAEAEAFETSKLTSACAAALAKTISDYKGKTYSTIDEYNNAINAVREAISTANANAAQYAKFNETKAGVEGIIAQTEVYTDNGAKSIAETAISTIEKDANTKIKAEDLVEIGKRLLTVAKTFMATVIINDDKCFDITALIVNPSFDANATDGWTYNEAPGYSSTGKNAEYYMKDFDFNQTLTDMPKGNYKLKVQAFQRTGNNDAAYAAWKAGTDVIDTYIYINDGQTKVKNVMSEYSEEALAGDKATAGAESWIDYKDELGHYHPNGMPGAALYFDKGMYENEILTSVEGKLTLGFKGKRADGAWTLFDNFRLYYYGTSIPVTISEDNDFSVVNDVENAKVTLNRTIKADVWNTIVLPFALTDGETKAAFGNDVQIATFSENSEDAANASVEFNIAASAAIEANVPVLLKTATAGNEYTFTGCTIKTLNGASAVTAGTNFSFTGTYAATCTVPENDYFISSNKLYRSKGATTLKGTRAYISTNPTASEAKIARFSIGGNDVTAIDGVFVEKTGNTTVYNMAGQRVAADKLSKGVYILNNKKIIVK